MSDHESPPELRKPLDIRSTPAQRAPSALPPAEAPYGLPGAAFGAPPAAARGHRIWLWVAAAVVLLALALGAVVTLVR